MMEDIHGLCHYTSFLDSLKNGMVDKIQIWHVDESDCQGVVYCKVTLTLQYKHTYIRLNFFVFGQYLKNGFTDSIQI